MNNNFKVLDVPAKAEDGVKTGVQVKRNDVFTVGASGRATFDNGRRVTYPDGTQRIEGVYAGGYMHPGSLLPGAPVGYAIVRVGSGPWLAAGTSQTFMAYEDGEVTVAYNDQPGKFGDNSGEYSVLVENHGPAA